MGPPKTAKSQPKINNYTNKLRRSKHHSEPNQMVSISEEMEEEITFGEEPLPEDSGLQQVIQKINGVCKRLENIELFLNCPDEGIQKRIESVERKTDIHDGKVLFMSKEYKAIKHDLNQIKGAVQRHAGQIESQEAKITDLTARSMSKNIIMSGIVEERNENCKEKFTQFLKDEMAIDLKEEHAIKVAHRLGAKREDPRSDRAMIIKVNIALKELILANIENLEGRSNVKGKSSYVNIQQPEAKIEARRNAKALLKRYQERHKNAKVELKGDKVYLNNEWQRPLVTPPKLDQLFYDAEDQKQLAKIKLCYTPPNR